jgi:hypothetical protein
MDDRYDPDDEEYGDLFDISPAREGYAGLDAPANLRQLPFRSFDVLANRSLATLLMAPLVAPFACRIVQCFFGPGWMLLLAATIGLMPTILAPMRSTRPGTVCHYYALLVQMAAKTKFHLAAAVLVIGAFARRGEVCRISGELKTPRYPQTASQNKKESQKQSNTRVGKEERFYEGRGVIACSPVASNPHPFHAQTTRRSILPLTTTAATRCWTQKALVRTYMCGLNGRRNVARVANPGSLDLLREFALEGYGRAIRQPICVCALHGKHLGMPWRGQRNRQREWRGVNSPRRTGTE